MRRVKVCAKAVLSVGLLVLAGWVWDAEAQEAKPSMKLGAYYFAGWAGKSQFDDGKPENAWAKGMPTHFTRKLATEFADRTPVWGWRDDTPELMERQINLAADHGIAFFSFCWYWHDNKGPINVKAIDDDSKHLPMRLFMQAKNNARMEFCLLVANHGGFEIVGPEAWKQAADYWMTLFKHPRYLRVEGKPLLVIFSPRGANKEGLACLQEAARKAGFPGVAVACCGNSKLEDGYLLRTRYNAVPGWGKSEKHQYKELVEAHVRTWSGTPEQRCIPVATVGWDRRPWEGPGGLGPKGSQVSWYFEGKTPQTFGDFLQHMVQWMDANPEQLTKDRLALIYAWNEIGEGGWLVPCRADPDGAYLKTIRRVVLGK
ncbi:MAG: glycoside hydrolase family 99-like domain-containing protein [Kiritimatiellae bacterium]|nr:glycoside hydrolase family 99-like domain-containing protein [Kiritimatiellia bacterium]MDD5522078.1 glycoside hydrolase family 99-like domain-containing protein [Kiritimatiellia bacterium]